MKVGIIGVGAVGTACAKAILLRGSCPEIVLLDLNKQRAKGVATDLSHGGVLCPPAQIREGDYDDLTDANIVVISAGKNEKEGGATNRADPRGRLTLLADNAEIYHKIVPNLVHVAPEATILVVTDPPEPLADVARDLMRELGLRNQVLSSGTFLDTIRFRLQIARQLNCHPASVDALVLGEHGTSQVYVWSSAQVGGVSVLEYIRRRGEELDSFRAKVEKAVKFANIDIIEGTGASQHAIGIVTARLVEAMLQNEGLVAPIGVFREQFSVTLSVPAIIGQGGVLEALEPELSPEEHIALTKSAEVIRNALADYLAPKPAAVSQG
jgi:L-lactate dehydrogenase